MVYVGMDVHRKRTQVAILEEDGTEVLNRNVSNTSGELAALLGPLDEGTSVAFEAAYGWSWLADLLEGLRLDIHLVHPSGCKAIAAAGSRTTGSTPGPWPTCSAPTSSRRRGSLRRR